MFPLSRAFFAAIAALAFSTMNGAGSPPPEIPLWPDGAPGALGTSPFDIPTLTPYVPPGGKANGAAMVVFPGGGYSGLATQREGVEYAQWLSSNGITVFVVKYRLAPHGYRHPAMLQDAARSVRYVRANAAKWSLDPKRIGVMGSSAGGHLASTILTHFDAGNPGASDPIERVSSRPDLGILCYPVIFMDGPYANKGSARALLGPNPPAELLEQLSSDKQVTRETPPCFLLHTWEDTVVPVENSLAFAAALRAHGIPFDLHIYKKGRHGLGTGLGEDGKGLGQQDARDPSKFHPWTHDCIYWLKEQGFVQ